jgi:hypothetical protein
MSDPTDRPPVRRARPPKPKTASRFARVRRDGKQPERKNKPGQGRPQSYFPTAEDRQSVERMAGLLAPYDEIAAAMRISKDTLERHYFEELARGSLMGKIGARRTVMAYVRGAPAEYDSQGNLIREEVKPDPAMIRFFARTKLGYVEEYKLRTGPNLPETLDDYDLTQLSDAEFEQLGVLLDKTRQGPVPAEGPPGNRPPIRGREAATRH